MGQDQNSLGREHTSRAQNCQAEHSTQLNSTSNDKTILKRISHATFKVYVKTVRGFVFFKYIGLCMRPVSFGPFPLILDLPQRANKTQKRTY